MFKIVDTGCFSYSAPKKACNEDALLLPTYDKENNLVFAIADGVGSNSGARQASDKAIKAVSDELKRKDFSVKSCFEIAKENIDNLSKKYTDMKNAATTLTVVKVSDSALTIGHIGDCRAYYKNGNKLIKITTDHTRYQELLDSGEHSKRKLQKHRTRLSSVLTKAVSHQSELDFDIISLPVSDISENGEITLVLMSDGAYFYWDKNPKFSDRTMSSPSAFSSSLRNRIEKNAHDDFTCVSVKFKISKKGQN